MISDSPITIRRSALIDETGRYRYALRREWDCELPRAMFCMLNPSTADDQRDDPTIRRCVGLARRWGCGSCEVVNLFAWRCTRPRDLRRAPDPVGPSNDRAIRRALARASVVVAGWGDAGCALGEAFRRRESRVRVMLSRGGHAKCLGLTRSARPRHPLYVRNDAPLVGLPGA